MSSKAFFFRLIAALGAGLCLLALFNWTINPIRLFNAADIKGVNAYKTAFFLELFISKPHIVSREQPDGVIFGTSRAGAALSTRHPGWSGYRAYNFALPGSTALVQWRNFQHASASGQLRLALVSLDFLMFNSCNDQGRQPHFQTYLERLKGGDHTNWAYAQRLLTDYLSQLTSWDALRTSWATVQAQPLFANGQRGVMHLQTDGFWQSYTAPKVRQRKVFQRTEKQYLETSWFPPPLHCFKLALDGAPTQQEYFNKLLQQAYRQNTEVVLYFSPFHARFAQAMVQAGLWPQFEQLKRDLVTLNVSNAERAEQTPFLLWDFSGFNSINTEPVPALDDSQSRMAYFFDGTHGKPLLGKLVQDVIFSLPSPGVQAPADFGVLLRPDTIDAVLAGDRAARKLWVSRNGQDVLEIAEIAALH